MSPRLRRLDPMQRPQVKTLAAGFKYVVLLWLACLSSELCGADSIVCTNSIFGNSGLIVVPSAYLPNDRQLSFGFHYLPKKVALVRRPRAGEKAFFVDIGFFPFLEVTAKLTRSDNLDVESMGIGERSVNLRLRLLTEGERYPALTFGVHDAVSGADKRFNSATYLVASKSLFSVFRLPFIVHAGYGVNLNDLGINKKWYKESFPSLNGPFCGIQVFYHHISFSAEYDAERINAGMNLTLFRKLTLYLAALGFDAASFGVGYQFTLGENFFAAQE
jgi:hypothetical protein